MSYRKASRRTNLTSPLFAALGLGLLSGCTGTVEQGPSVNLTLLTQGGAALQRVELPAGVAGTPSPTAVLGDPVPVEGGVDLHPQTGERRVLLTRRAAIEERSAALATLTTFGPTPFGEPCWQASAVSPGSERLFALSQCEGGPQNVALYDNRGVLQWWTTLPLATPPADAGTGVNPPIRVAVIGEVGVVSRPVLGGGSEMIRVTVLRPGDTRAEFSTPQRTLAVRDLATYSTGGKSTVYAATDGGIFPLNTAGVPDANPLAAFGAQRYDRLWASSSEVGDAPILVGWRGEPNQLGLRHPLRIWNGSSTAENSAQTVDSFADLRDAAVADGYLYLLTRDSLLRYDAVLGVRQNNWRLENLGLKLNDARALVRTFAAE